MTLDQVPSPRNGSTEPTSPMGKIQRIDDRTVVVLGQELNVDAKQPDVANALVHRMADTIVIVDTGVTEKNSETLCGRP